MPKEKKENSLILIETNNSFNTNTIKNSIESNNNKDSNATDFKEIQKLKKNLPFKNPEFISKFRNKEKPNKSLKTPKNISIDNLDTISLNICKFFS